VNSEHRENCHNHCHARCQERYGVQLTHEMKKRILSDIRDGSATKIKDLGYNNYEAWRVIHKTNTFNVVYEPLSEILVTFLPKTEELKI